MADPISKAKHPMLKGQGRRLLNLPTELLRVVKRQFKRVTKHARGLTRFWLIRVIAFDLRFKPRNVCRNLARRNVAVYDVRFEKCKYRYQVFRVPHGRLHSDRSTYIAITTQNELLPGASFQRFAPNAPEVPPEQISAFDWGRINTRPERVTGTVFALLPGPWGNNNYYHWLTAALPRIFLAQKAGLKVAQDLYLIPNSRIQYQVETLNLLGIPNEALLSITESPHISADTIIATTYPSPNVLNIPQWILDWLRDMLLQDSAPHNRGSHIYIGRGDAGKRRLLNEQECLSKVLEPLGFHSYQLSNMAVTSQADLFASADKIVAIHGASLTNLVFCKPGAKVIELVPARWQLPMFQNIARERGLDYHVIVCKEQYTGPSWRDPDFLVPTDELASRL
jgi:Glycosyltransferase 61